MGSAVASSDTVYWLSVDRALSYIALSAVIVAAYDHVTTIDSEIELIWKRPKWTIVQILFIICRYLGFVMQLYTAYTFMKHILLNETAGYVHVCYHLSFNYMTVFTVSQILTVQLLGPLFHTISGYMASIVLFSMQGIMMFRVSSMYLNTRKINLLLGAAFVTEIAVVIGIQIVEYVADELHTPIPQPAPGVELCKRHSFSKLPAMICIPILIFETFLLVLSAAIGIKYHRSRMEISTNHQSRNKSLLYVLLRDSIAFPFIIVLCALVNLIADLHFSYLIIQMVYIPPTLAPVILGPRLILNLREAYYAPYAEEVNSSDWRSSLVSSPGVRYPVIRFGRHSEGVVSHIDFE